ncbi:hypothetical protein DPQ33_02280 [Oceanidesulfovibrio indonesiensis]|uniref:Cytochrome c domain-containing protein n=1 Tax=Oceanidesulfovibrio indonesiensis TaxID=54767 RepID=A0A7M3MHN8_9BACT|nr:hypothetical protein DPQ33_02280 [Oceanidesulfovibrio indonesiensis]
MCCLAAVLAACATVEVDKTGMTTGDDYVQGVCNQCHTHERICEKLGKDSDYWSGTVGFMRMMGAPLDDSEKELVVNHLASLDAGDPSICQATYEQPPE